MAFYFEIPTFIGQSLHIVKEKDEIDDTNCVHVQGFHCRVTVWCLFFCLIFKEEGGGLLD